MQTELYEMIYKGLCEGVVKIIQSPNDDCIACSIGQYWFYFIGSEDEDMTPDEVYESYTKEELTDLILSAINELDETESTYYRTFLEEYYTSNVDSSKVSCCAECEDCVQGIGFFPECIRFGFTVQDVSDKYC